MRVGILGAGAVGCGMAAHLAQFGHEVSLWSPSGTRTMEFAAGDTLIATGAIDGIFTVRAAPSCADVVADADVVVLAIPGYGHRFALEAVALHLRDGQPLIISSHMSFSALYISKLLAARGVRSPIVAWGTTLLTGRQLSSKEVKVGTVRRKIDIATLPASDIDKAHALCVSLFGNRFEKRDGLLAIALSNLNPQNHLGIALLNLTRMEQGEEWSQSGNMTATVGRLIEALDRERLGIAREFDLSVRTVHEHLSFSYEIQMDDISAMSAEMYRRGLGGSGPKTIDSRYVLEDVPYGLVPTVLLGQITCVRAALHEAGIALLSAAYGRDFTQENNLLCELGLERMTMPQLQKLMRFGYGSA